MNLPLIGGISLMLFGSILFTGEKSLGLHNQPLGVLLIGGGFLLALYSYIDGNGKDDSGPRARSSTGDRFV